MAPLLRKAKSTVHDAASSPKPIDPANNSTVQRHHRLQKTQAQDLSARILDQDSNLNKRSRTLALSQRLQSSDHPLTEFRRRLARKASTLTLRTKIRQGGFQSRGRDQGQNEAKEEKKRKERELLSLGGEEVVQQFRQQRDEVGRDQVQVHELPSHRSIRSLSHSSVTTAIPAATAKTPDTVTTPTPFVKDFPSREQTSDPRESSISLQELIRKEQASHISKDVQVGKILVKNDNMASELAAPPVPYTRLKEITEKACEAALTGVTAYSHPDTETWNTTIINSILGALVEETAQKPTSGTSPTQPQFKYVVNSTIIQHAAVSSSSAPGDTDTKKVSGRRGMHAASGAYWNNEKDGMWSFKYPGADSKGLDVVVGIIWVWVG